ncbi:MAG: zinc-ribbon domain-containing protein [Lachnospiraceae bacterium]
MYCPNCGNPVPDESASCPACGTLLNQGRRQEGTNDTYQQAGFSDGTADSDSRQDAWNQSQNGQQGSQGSWNQNRNGGQNSWNQAQQAGFQQPRTRLGITVGMLGAAIYVSALISPVVLGLLAIYVLFLEENHWLKASAIKAVICYLGFFVVFQVIDGINYFLSIINRMMSMVHWYPDLSFPGSITDALSICRIVFFLVVAFGALKMRDLRMDRIDEFVETHM